MLLPAPIASLLIGSLGLLADAKSTAQTSVKSSKRVICDGILYGSHGGENGFNGCFTQQGFYAKSRDLCHRFLVYEDTFNTHAMAQALGSKAIAVIVVNKSMATKEKPGPFFCSVDSEGLFSCAAGARPKHVMAWGNAVLQGYTEGMSISSGWRNFVDDEALAMARSKLKLSSDPGAIKVKCERHTYDQTSGWPR